jgi:hypothetical protein
MVALNYERKSEAFVKCLSDGLSITLTRNDVDGETQMHVKSPDSFNLHIEVSELDIDEARTQAQSQWRTTRTNGEQIIIEGLGDASLLTAKAIYVCKLKDDDFLVMADNCFEYINKIYSPFKYNASSLSVPNSVLDESERLIDVFKNGKGGKGAINRIRELVYNLEEIIHGKATDQLRYEATDIKKDMENTINKFREEKRKLSNQSLFKERLREKIIESLKDFIREHHGHATLSKIESEALRRTTEDSKISSVDAKEGFNTIKGFESEMIKIEQELETNRFKENIDNYLTLGIPPKVLITHCSRCGSKARFAKIEGISTKQKKHKVTCMNCSETVIGGRIGIDAIIKWNTVHKKNIKPQSLDVLGVLNTSDDAAIDVLRYVEGKMRWYSLVRQAKGNSALKVHNKEKGMMSILSIVYKEAIKLKKSQGSVSIA